MPGERNSLPEASEERFGNGASPKSERRPVLVYGSASCRMKKDDGLPARVRLSGRK